MGTKVQCKSYLPGYYPMRDLNETSNSCSWPLYYGDKTVVNGQYYNGFLPRTATDLYPVYDKDAVKQTMIEHEAIFKNQVYELHRLYRIQRDLMDEFKRKELHKNQMPVETSLSSSPLASQITTEDARKWHLPSFPPANSGFARPSVSCVEDIHSALSSMKGNRADGVPFRSHNGFNSTDLEVLECRPKKARRKMFDLQLPADEYIDSEEGEQFSEEKVSGMSSYLFNRDHKVALDSDVKLFLGDSGKSGFPGDALTSDSCLETGNGLADLNDPVPVEERSASRYVDLLGRGACHLEIQGPDLSAKPNSQFINLPKGILLNSHHGSDAGTRNSQHLENHGNGKGWFCQVLQAGRSKNNLKSTSQGVQPEISSKPMQVFLNKGHESSAYYLTDESKVASWGDRRVCALDISERSHEISSNKHLGSTLASNVPSPYPVTPSDLAKSWSHSVSSWEKQSSSLSQKSMPVPKQPCLNSSTTLSKSSQSSAQSNGFLGDAWHLKGNSTCNRGLRSEAPDRNGFYPGSSSGSKELQVNLPSISCDPFNFSNDHSRASGLFYDKDLVKFYKGSDYVETRSLKDENLNVVLSNSSSNKVSLSPGFEIIDGGHKHEDHLKVLPWLRPKPASNAEAAPISGRVPNTEEPSFLQSSPDQWANRKEMERISNPNFCQNIRSVSCSNDVDIKRVEICDYPSDRKILGFPIFEKSRISKNDSSSFTSPSVPLPPPSEGEVAENNRKNRFLDINLPCETAVPDSSNQTAEILVNDNKTDANVSSFRHIIDLNSSISDDEALLVPSVASTNLQITAGIDLEAPIIVETEDDAIPGDVEEKQYAAPSQPPQHKAEHSQDEFMMTAAEAIVAISSSGFHKRICDSTSNPSEASITDHLNWFVEIVASWGDDIENKYDTVLRVIDGEDNEEEGSDYFESMTLKLTETKEEDYMPKPLVPENLRLEESGTPLLPTRPRKGQARRGRQRRDFQRDILPGLASLSRHEVTEDLQTFGGLMRATGHSWHSGLTRRSSARNGCGRGRRRSVASTSPAVPTSPACTPLIQQLNIEVGLEDRSLTGWGKTTRRPRRQRCPAGNHPSVPLT